MPGFEIAGYDRALLDAFSGRRREILQMLEANGLPYTPALAQMAALRTRRRKVDIGLAALIPQWRARTRSDALRVGGPPAPAARPRDRPTLTQGTRRAAQPSEERYPQPRSRARARPGPALDASAPLPTGPAAPATLVRAPEVGVLEAVGRAVAAIEERMAVFPETEVQALVLGHAPGRYSLAEIDAAIAKLVRDGEVVDALPLAVGRHHRPRAVRGACGAHGRPHEFTRSCMALSSRFVSTSGITMVCCRRDTLLRAFGIRYGGGCLACASVV